SSTSEERLNQVGLSSRSPDRQGQLVTEMVKIKTAQVAEFDMFEVLPDPFIRIEVRGIGREALQMNLPRPAIGQELFHFFRPMDRGAIPDDQQFAPEIRMQVLQKADAVQACHRARASHCCQVPFAGDPTYHRQMIPCLKHSQDGRLTARGISPDHSGQQVKGSFINADNTAPLKSRLFFNSGQTLLRQRATSRSLRCVARSSGFCGVHLMALSRRETWAGWYETPNSHSITVATRRQVQTSPRKPYASAPAVRKSSNRSNSSAESFGSAPGCGRACKPASPFSRAALIHLLTALSEMPKASAISSRVHPSRLSSRARYRRTCLQSGVRAWSVFMPAHYQCLGGEPINATICKEIIPPPGKKTCVMLSPFSWMIAFCSKWTCSRWGRSLLKSSSSREASRRLAVGKCGLSDSVIGSPLVRGRCRKNTDGIRRRLCNRDLMSKVCAGVTSPITNDCCGRGREPSAGNLRRLISFALECGCYRQRPPLTNPRPRRSRQ